MSISEVIKTRRSIRKFKETDIPRDKILELLRLANLAPTAGNKQPWEFIVISRKEIVKLYETLEEAFDRRTEEISAEKYRIALNDLPIPVEDDKDKLAGLKKFYKYLGNAPAVVVAYADRQDDDWLWMCTVQDLAAAIQTLIIAAWAEGIGSCWMTGPFHKGSNKIREILGLPEGKQLVAMIPIGYPSIVPKSPPKKEVDPKIRWMGF